jgi:hypothetical protein
MMMAAGRALRRAGFLLKDRQCRSRSPCSANHERYQGGLNSLNSQNWTVVDGRFWRKAVIPVVGDYGMATHDKAVTR